VQILQGHKDVVPELAFSPDGTLLASASGEEEGMVRVWDRTGTAIAVLKSWRFAHPRLAFSPDGRWLATPGPDKYTAALVWDMSDPGRPIELPLNSERDFMQWTQAVAFTPDGHTLVAAGQRNIVWHDEGPRSSSVAGKSGRGMSGRPGISTCSRTGPGATRGC
jgi:WD40 repeat protein